MRKSGSILLIAILSTIIPFNTAVSKELSLKGAVLGMSLQQFKQNPIPIKEDFMIKNNYVASRIICDDLGENLQSCSYQGQNRQNSRWIDIRVGFAGLEPDIHHLGKTQSLKDREIITSVHYIFFNEKLMAIGIKIGTKLFDKVLPNFISYYGKPHSSVDKSFKNPYGAEIGNIEAVWIEKNNKLAMKKFNNSASFGSITFLNTTLMSEYEKSIDTDAAKSDF